MEPNDKIFDQRTFDTQPLQCPNCGWSGEGSAANVIGFYGIGKFQQVICPKCDEYLGNLSKDHPYGQGRERPNR